MEQLYAIQIDLAVAYPKHAEQYIQSGPARYTLHSGGRGNGAQGGLYTKGQLNRIIGKYAAGAAKAIPVAFGYDQNTADSNAEDSDWLSCLEQAGVDNWCGYDEAIGIQREQQGEANE